MLWAANFLRLLYSLQHLRGRFGVTMRFAEEICDFVFKAEDEAIE